MKKKRKFVTSREAAEMLKMKNEGKTMDAIVKATGRTWKTVKRALSPGFRAKIIEPIPILGPVRGPALVPHFSAPARKPELSTKSTYDWCDEVAYEVMGGLLGKKSAEDALRTIGEILAEHRGA